MPDQANSTEQRAEDQRRSRERYIRFGVGQPSGDPAQHRVFDVRATYSAAAGGWVARLGELSVNDQFQGFGARLTDGHPGRPFDTAAACLGDAVTTILAMVDAATAC
jgi:hypothetical protein